MEATRLTPRDIDILRALAEFRSLDRSQIQTRFFSPTYAGMQGCNRRLKQLLSAGLIARQRQLLVDGLGDLPAVYCLTVDGAHRIGEKKRSREMQAGAFVLEHRKLSNSLLLRLELAAQELGWVANVEAEPTLRAELRGKDVPIPDGRLYLTTSRASFCALLECDLGTEWAKGKLRRKFEAYLQSRKDLQKVHGSDKIRVLVVTRARANPLQYTTNPEDNAKRVEEIMRVLRGLTEDSEMICLTTFDEFMAANPLTAPIWRTAPYRKPIPLFH